MRARGTPGGRGILTFGRLPYLASRSFSASTTERLINLRSSVSQLAAEEGRS
jgi:hypothetical protein